MSGLDTNAFLEDWYHQGSGPVSKDSASVHTSLKNELENGSSDITSCFEYSCSYRTIALWVWRLLNRFSIPALEGNIDL